MSGLSIPWAPRVLLVDRVFRLPVVSMNEDVPLHTEHFESISRRRVPADSATYHYLRAPSKSGDYDLSVEENDNTANATIQVRTLEEMRRPHEFNGAKWPRRWPLGATFSTNKTRQTLQDTPCPDSTNADLIAWWTSQDDQTLWNQLPPAEIPKAHFTNCHQGCPNCGTLRPVSRSLLNWLVVRSVRQEPMQPACWSSMWPESATTSLDFSASE